MVFENAFQSAHAVEHVLDLVACFFQTADDKLGDFLFIFHQQNFGSNC